MVSAYDSVEKRREFLYRIIGDEFKVRMHSYEYFIRGKKFVCIVVLHPQWNFATVHRIPWNIEEPEKAVEKILREVEPNYRSQSHLKEKISLKTTSTS